MVPQPLAVHHQPPQHTQFSEQRGGLLALQALTNGAPSSRNVRGWVLLCVPPANVGKAKEQVDGVPTAQGFLVDVAWGQRVGGCDNGWERGGVRVFWYRNTTGVRGRAGVGGAEWTCGAAAYGWRQQPWQQCSKPSTMLKQQLDATVSMEQPQVQRCSMNPCQAACASCSRRVQRANNSVCKALSPVQGCPYALQLLKLGQQQLAHASFAQHSAQLPAKLHCTPFP